MTELNRTEAFVLEWLAKEDTSQYGECSGPALDSLLNQGLCEVIEFRSPMDYSRIAMTQKGRSVMKGASTQCAAKTAY